MLPAALDPSTSPHVTLNDAPLNHQENSGSLAQPAKHMMMIVQTLPVDGVVVNACALKVVIEELACRPRTLGPVITNLSFQHFAHNVRSQIRSNLERFFDQCSA